MTNQARNRGFPDPTLTSDQTKTNNQDDQNDQNDPSEQAVILPEAWFFKNWMTEDAQWQSRFIARASAAAPTLLNNTRFGPFRSIIDGGLAANAPGMCALAECLKVAKPGDDFLAVTLGTGYPNKKYSYRSLRYRPSPLYIGPALELFGVMMPAVVKYQLKAILNVQMPNSLQFKGVDPDTRPCIRYLDLDAEMPPDMFSSDNIDKKNVQAELDLAARTVENNRDKVEQMIKELIRAREMRLSGSAEHTIWPFVANTGGGARGVFTAALMNLFWQMTAPDKASRLHPTELFWLNAGNSAGSLNTMFQTAPNKDGTPKYTPDDAQRIYQEVLPIVFKTNWWRTIGQYVGLGAKYPNSGIESVLLEYLGNTLYGDHIGRVMVPAVVTDYQT
jgi:hypothetical protein